MDSRTATTAVVTAVVVWAFMKWMQQPAPPKEVKEVAVEAPAVKVDTKTPEGVEDGEPLPRRKSKKFEKVEDVVLAAMAGASPPLSPVPEAHENMTEFPVGEIVDDTFGAFSREIRAAFAKRAKGASHLTARQIFRLCLEDLGVRPSMVQLRELCVHARLSQAGRRKAEGAAVQAARSMTRRSSSWNTLQTVYLSGSKVRDHPENAELGHVAMFVQALKRIMSQATVAKTKKKSWKKDSEEKTGTDCQVFLGGSCNPTTWRKDVAIPLLENANIVYYNPQVDNWSPDLVEIEEHAKTSSNILFFVLDNQTRGVASMVEVAYLAGHGREMVTVMIDFDSSSSICGRHLSAIETRDLNRGRDFLCSILRVECIPVFNEVTAALGYITSMIRTGKGVAELAADKFVSVPVFRGLELSDGIISASDHFCKAAGSTADYLSADAATKAVGMYFGKDVFNEVDIRTSLEAGSEGASEIDQDAFLCAIADLKYVEAAKEAKASPAELQLKRSASADSVDIFLGGCCFRNAKGHDVSADWREVFAIPNLKKLGVSFYNPDIAGWNPTHIANESEVKRKSKMLLVVVGRNTRGIGSLVEASHLIGEGRTDLVLCLQDVVVNSVIEGHKVDEAEAKDLNRGRCYLEDVALRNNVPVSSSIQDALSMALGKLGVSVGSSMLARSMSAPQSKPNTSPKMSRKQVTTRWSERFKKQERLRLRSGGARKMTRSYSDQGTRPKERRKSSLQNEA